MNGRLNVIKIKGNKMADIKSVKYGEGDIIDVVGISDIRIRFYSCPDKNFNYDYCISLERGGLYFYNEGIKKICMHFTNNERLADENIKNSFHNENLSILVSQGHGAVS